MRENFRERWDHFTREQRVALVVGFGFGAMILGLSVYRIQDTIRRPFYVDRREAMAFLNTVQPSDEEIVAKQQRTDTDGDGISDWDEITTYKTNPNLRDTCGDGLSDNIRIATGKNVNCADQQVRGVLDLSAIGATSSGFNLHLNAPSAEQLLFQATQSIGGVSTSTMASPPRDAQAIREALKGKVDPSALEKVTDEELLRYYDEAKAEQAASSTTSL